MLPIVMCVTLLTLSAIMALLLLVHHALLWYYEEGNIDEKKRKKLRCEVNPVVTTERNGKRKLGVNQAEQLKVHRNRFYSESSCLRRNPKDSKKRFNVCETKTVNVIERSVSYEVGGKNRKDSYSLRFENSRETRRESNVWYTMNNSVCGRYELQMMCDGPTRQRSYRLVPHTNLTMNNGAEDFGEKVKNLSHVDVDRKLCQSSYHIGSTKFTVIVKQKSAGSSTV